MLIVDTVDAGALIMLYHALSDPSLCVLLDCGILHDERALQCYRRHRIQSH